MTLMEYLPPEVYGGPEVRAIQGAVEEQVKKLWSARNGLFDQLTVDTATWGLSAWEDALGIPRSGARSADLRRAKIKAKLRGQGVTTVAMVKAVAQSYTSMAVEIGEYPPEYRVEIRFLGALGDPANLPDLTATLGEILPAHLDYDYVFIHHLGTHSQYGGFFLHLGDVLHFKMQGGSGGT